jgi:hypothetical protein
MHKFFSRERFGKPQVLAGLLLLIFVGECTWLLAHSAPIMESAEEVVRVHEGLEQWHGHGIAGTPAMQPDTAPEWAGLRSNEYDPDHSPLWYLIGAAPVAALGVAPDTRFGLWLTHFPYVLFGVLLGASVWYVSRRLYGNSGGYIALALYCFSPAVVRSSALWVAPPDIAAAWGTFGAVFTAIAVSHTLYAPREVILWNWRRIVLLGISLALAAGSQFSLALIIPVLLVFMLYLAPARKSAALVILCAASAVGLALLFAAYFFHPEVFLQSLRHARLFTITTAALGMKGAYLQVLKEVASSGPVLVVLIPAALLTYVLWPRSRYFGNTAPLLIALLFLALRVAAPHDPDSVFCLIGAVFLFVFVAGIMADLLETKAQELAAAVITGLLAANALWNLIGLGRIG